MRRHALVPFAIAIVLVVTAIVFATRHGSRPRYIFINETAHHEHDLALKMSLKIAESRSGIENALILLHELPPQATLEGTADRLFERWQIGRDRGGKGLLLLYSERENLFRIEVSYALEGLFPDAFCRRMEEAAKTYMLSDIPQDFLTELLITLNVHGRENREELAETFALPGFLAGGAGAKVTGYHRSLRDYTDAIQRLPAAQLDAFAPSTDPDTTVERYLQSLEQGLGDPRLPLLTEGSRIFRTVVPRNTAQQHRVWRYYRKAMPYHIFVHSDLALVTFHPGVANLPIVLRHARRGEWYVDEPKSWTYFHRFEDQSDFSPKYGDLPFLRELAAAHQPNALRPVFGDRVRTPKVGSYPDSLLARVEDLERKIARSAGSAQLHVELGEIYLFEIAWVRKALEQFEAAAKLDPNRLDVKWRLWDLYINDSQPEKALEQLKMLSKALPRDAEVQEWYRFYSKAYAFAPGEF